jgi:hypothetical protein
VSSSDLVVVLLTTEPSLDPLNTVKAGIVGVGDDYALGVKGLRGYKKWLGGGEEAMVWMERKKLCR